MSGWTSIFQNIIQFSLNTGVYGQRMSSAGPERQRRRRSGSNGRRSGSGRDGRRRGTRRDRDGRRRRGRRASSEPTEVQIIGEVAGAPTIDLTCEDQVEFVDLTTPRAVNDQDPIIVSSQSDSPRRPRMRLTRQAESLTDLANVDDSDIEELPDLDPDPLPPVPFDLGAGTSDSGPSTSNGSGDGNSSFTSPTASLKCPVCFESHKEVKQSGRRIMSTNCGHIFCEDCIHAAIQAQHKCPTCRKKLTNRQIHPIFL